MSLYTSMHHTFHITSHVRTYNELRLCTHTTASTQSALYTSQSRVMSLYTWMSHVSIYNESRLYTYDSEYAELYLHHVHESCLCIHQWAPTYTLSQFMCMTSSVHTWDMTHSYDENELLICVTPLFPQWVHRVQATLHLEAIQGQVKPGRPSQKSARYSIY